jgi:hypothetical protein
MVAAAVQLADLLARENAALEAIDLPLAASMVPEKQRAASAFAVAAAAAGTLEGIHRAAAEDTARRLQALAAENKRLLERAIAVQGRLIGTIATALPPRAGPRYGARGAAGQHGRPVAYALAARA